MKTTRTIIFTAFMFGTLGLGTAVLSGCESCGYTSIDNNMVGQVKKIHHNTPIICPNYISADVSLGIMQNGVGSISNHDVQMTIFDFNVLKVMEDAAKTGKLVEINFKERRATTCINEYIAIEAKFLEESKKVEEKKIEELKKIDQSKKKNVVNEHLKNEFFD